jgi:hypothetical protein
MHKLYLYIIYLFMKQYILTRVVSLTTMKFIQSVTGTEGDNMLTEALRLSKGCIIRSLYKVQ